MLKPTLRRNLSDEIADHLRDLIVDGSLRPGERINEVHFAEALEVSRTPLREALSRLASEGFVVARPRRGFFVQKTTEEEVRQLYQIRSLLDPAALRLAGVPKADQLQKLEELNEQLHGAAGQPSRAVDLDDLWHLELLAHCPNRILLEMIQQHMKRTRMTEHVYLREGSHLGTACDEHERILEALRRHDLDAAVAALQRNMQSAEAPLAGWAAGAEDDE